ncbi:MAG: UMP kinase [Candidatus Marinimicrobia bacterium]|nr:UMP kinase [Candidatus Neomarinimicrobiota bacterium]|tara:strand:- start:635 stop:1351 length:717 start_codon:yes stop_codon:yes gene_type:complete
MSSLHYKRVLIKLSGEVFSGNKDFGIDYSVASFLANQIKEIHHKNIQIGIVIGGGNIFRGISSNDQDMDRVSADYIGMMATIMNSVALQSQLEKINCDTRVMSALSIRQLAEPYIRRRATRHLEKGRIVIFGGGTGNPYFTTDTAAVLRAIEIKADIIIKGTKVDGVYDSDPVKNLDAKKYDTLSYKEVIDNELRVMDLTAITLCKENKLPIGILDINDKKNLKNFIFSSKIIGTKIT